jgi:voltage-gated potassium channel
MAVLLAGTAGYIVAEGWGPIHAFYSTVLVISTLGLTQAPKTAAGQVLTILLIVSGVGTLFFLLSQSAEQVIERSLGSQRERRVKRQIAALRGHHIICGYGRVGRHAAHELAAEKRPFVIVDIDPDMIERARADGCPALQGDATEDFVLKAAGIERAASLLITTASDAANVFITLSVRAVNPKLHIIVRASEDSSEAKLKKAGADYVIAPETIGGKRMAALAVQADATEIVDHLSGAHDEHSWLDQIIVEHGSSLAGQRLGECRLVKDTGSRVIAIRRRDGQTIVNPGQDEFIREGDVLISVGQREEHEILEDRSYTGINEEKTR